MVARTAFFGRPAMLSLAVVFLIPSLAATGTASGTRWLVDCRAGETIQGALPSLSPGDTLLVRGTCFENVEIFGPTGQFDGVTLDGQGTATISGRNASQNTIQLTSVRNITVKGFRITGGNDGLVVNAGERVAVESNIIERVGRHGIHFQRGTTMAHLINCVIQDNPSHGIVVNENSYVRIGFTSGVGSSEGDTGPNIIQRNGGHGIHIQQTSLARIYLNTIRDNAQNGVNIQKLSYAEVASNTIEGNTQNGVQATQNSGLHLGNPTGTANEDRPNDTRVLNGQWGISLSLGAYAVGRLGTLTGVRGPKIFTTGANDGLSQ